MAAKRAVLRFRIRASFGFNSRHPQASKPARSCSELAPNRAHTHSETVFTHTFTYSLTLRHILPGTVNFPAIPSFLLSPQYTCCCSLRSLLSPRCLESPATTPAATLHLNASGAPQSCSVRRRTRA
eukprot:229024-Rhodomonas_salina.1